MDYQDIAFFNDFSAALEKKCMLLSTTGPGRPDKAVGVWVFGSRKRCCVVHEREQFYTVKECLLPYEPAVCFGLLVGQQG